MACNTLAIGRSSKQQYDALCASGGSGVTATAVGCGTGVSGCLSHDRNLSPRKYREKVREDIKDYVILMLGGPQVRVELNEQNLDLAVDEALRIFEDYAPRDFFQYYTFMATPGKSVYKLPDDVGMVRNVFYKQQGTYAFQSNDLDGAIPLNYFNPGGAYASIQGGLINPVQPIWGNMGEWVLYKQYEQMYARTSSNIGGWEWVGDHRHIKLYPTPCGCSTVIVHYLQKCTDWKEATQGMREGALAFAMIALGHIRGKYTNIPGPNGGVQNDGDYMRTKGWELKDKWEERLISRWGDLPYISFA